jgi:hypothetical protein
MQRISAWLGGVTPLLVAWLVLGSPPVADPASAADNKGAVVTLDGLKSQAPGDWKEEAPTNRMRFQQFRLPKKGNDSDDAELIIFKGLGGSAQANIKRWKDQFAPPEGKTIDDVAKVEEIKIGDKPATYLDVQGTYLFRFPPFDPNAKIQRKPHYRMLAVHFEGPQNIYHIKLTGPAKTIEAYKGGFDDWLKNFK